jgi:hypothetical protein
MKKGLISEIPVVILITGLWWITLTLKKLDASCRSVNMEILSVFTPKGVKPDRLDLSCDSSIITWL